MKLLKLLVVVALVGGVIDLTGAPVRGAYAAPRANFCNVENLWAASAFGSMPGNQGAVFFNIFNEAPPATADNDGSESYALATQLALGLGNAGQGDKYHFRFETTLVSNGATA